MCADRPSPHEVAGWLQDSYQRWRHARGFTAAGEPSVFAYPAYTPGFAPLRVCLGIPAHEAEALAAFLNAGASPPTDS